MANNVQIKKMNWWHEAIFEWILENPEKKLGDAAKFFKVQQSWLSVVINSDVFQERLRARRDEHFSNVSRNTVERMQGLTDLSLDILEERLEDERVIIPLGIVKETAEMGLRAMGYTGPKAEKKPGGDTVVNVNITQQDLVESRALMNKANPVITVEAEEVE
jgi:hypothetical protein